MAAVRMDQKDQKDDTEQFNSVQDSFEDGFDDSVTLYGATTERSPLKGHKNLGESSGATQVLIQDPHRYKIPIEETASDSLVRDDNSDEEYDPSQPWWRHPKIRENWKVVLAATALLIVGIGLFVIGISISLESSFSQGIVFLIAGVICFIPGVYHVIYIYLAVKGHRGYHFYHLPLFN